MSLGPVSGSGDRGLSPVGGRLPPTPLSTAGTPQAVERAAEQKLAWLSEADVDVFLRAAAAKAQGPQKKGIAGLLQKLAGAPPPPSATGAQVKAELRDALGALAAVYADGVVSEHELGALLQAKGRLEQVLTMLSPDVMLMLPRDVRERLETQLRDPLHELVSAAGRRSHRLFAAIEQRDAGALRERLNDPVEFRSLDLSVLARAGLQPTSLSRYVPGDLICVPRTDGSFSPGVVVQNHGASLDVEMLTADGQFAKKSLDAAAVAHGNPLKIGDTFMAAGQKVWVTGVTARGLVGAVDGPSGRTQVGASDLAALYAQGARSHAGQTLVARALGSVQAYAHADAKTQRALFALGALKDDPVFGRLASELSHQAQRPEFLAMHPAGQARVFEQLLQKTEWLPEVMPPFGALRESVSDVRYQQPYLESGAAHFQMNGGHPTAVMQPIDVMIGAAQATVTVAISADLPEAERHKLTVEVADTLRRLPPEVLKGLRTVVINPTPSPLDAHFAAKFNIPNFTSAMTAHADTRAVTVYPGSTIAKAVQEFCHEVGHIVSIDVFGSISDNGGPGWAAWTQAAANDPIACSRYALKAAHEDFAETFSLYTSTKGTLRHDAYRALMPHRFALLDQIAQTVAR